MKYIKIVLSVLVVAVVLYAQVSSTIQLRLGTPPNSPANGRVTLFGNINTGAVDCIANVAGDCIQPPVVRSVKSAGVKCDGVTNDNAAMQTVLNTAGTWALPKDKTCIIDFLTGSTSHVKLIGDGTIFQRLNSGTAGQFFVTWAQGVDDVRISGVTFEQNGFAQSAGYPYQLFAYQVTNFQFDNDKFINSGAAQNTLGGIYLSSSTGRIEKNTFNLPGIHVFIQFASGAVHIQNNEFDNTHHNAVQVWDSGSPGQVFVTDNTYSNVLAIPSSTECMANDGPCGNAISAFDIHGAALIVSHNTLIGATFSFVRFNGVSNGVIQGNVGFGMGEDGIWSEFGSEGNSITNNTLNGVSVGIVNTNIAQRPNGQQDVISGNTVTNARSACYIIENAHFGTNDCSQSPNGLSIGSNAVGFGNVVDSITCNKVGVCVSMAAGLSDTPANQIGVVNNQNPLGIADYVVPMKNTTFNYVNVTSITNEHSVSNGGAGAGIVVACNPSCVFAPTAGQTVMLINNYNMTQINGLPCTVGTVTGSDPNFSFHCTNIDSFGFTAFGANPGGPAGNQVPQVELIYRIGSTYAYTLPAVLQRTPSTDQNGYVNAPGWNSTDLTHTGLANFLPGTSANFSSTIPAGQYGAYVNSTKGNLFSLRDSAGNEFTVGGPRHLTFNDTGPVIGDSGQIVVIDSTAAIHINRLWCAVQGGTSVVLNLDKRAEGTIGSDSGAHLLGGDLTAGTGGANTSTFSNTPCGGTMSCAVAAHTPVVATFASVNSMPSTSALNCSMDYTVD